MKKPTAEKVIIVHRPQKPSCQQSVPAASAPVDCGNEMVAPDMPGKQAAATQAPTTQEAKNS